MTKANDAARARVADAEKRTKRKIKRLQNKGVRTGDINPLQTVDASDTRALNRYAKQLEAFVSRQTRFIAGRDGTPIPYAAYRDYKRIERDWNKAHDRYWHSFADRPYLTAYGQSDMSLGERSAASHVKGLPFGNIGYKREVLPEQIKSAEDLKNRMKILKRELSPSYQKQRIKQLRKNLIEHAASFNDPAIPKAIKRLSDEQLFALQNFTNFVPLYYRYINTDRDNSMGGQADAMDDEAQKQHMLLTIEQVQKQVPRTTPKRKPKKRKRD